MQNDISTVNSFTRRIEVVVPWETLADQFEAFFKTFSKKINLPGFLEFVKPIFVDWKTGAIYLIETNQNWLKQLLSLG